MATAPCLFRRPEGTELVRKAKTKPGACPDLPLIIGSNNSAFSRQRLQPSIRFHTTDEENWRSGLYYVDVHVLATMPCGPNRVHILGWLGNGNHVIIENFNYLKGKGDLFEFEGVRSYLVGTVYLFDLGRTFPVDLRLVGTVIKACFNGDARVSELQELLSERGYLLAPFSESRDETYSVLDSIGDSVSTEVWRLSNGEIGLVDSLYHISAEILPEDGLIKAGQYVMAVKTG